MQISRADVSNWRAAYVRPWVSTPHRLSLMRLRRHPRISAGKTPLRLACAWLPRTPATFVHDKPVPLFCSGTVSPSHHLSLLSCFTDSSCVTFSLFLSHGQVKGHRILEDKWSRPISSIHPLPHGEGQFNTLLQRNSRSRKSHFFPLVPPNMKYPQKRVLR